MKEDRQFDPRDTIFTERQMSTNLDKQLLDDHVVDHSAVAPRALAETALRIPGARHTHSASERSGTIGQQLHLLEVSRVQGIRSIDVFLLQSLMDAPLQTVLR